MDNIVDTIAERSRQHHKQLDQELNYRMQLSKQFNVDAANELSALYEMVKPLDGKCFILRCDVGDYDYADIVEIKTELSVRLNNKTWFGVNNCIEMKFRTIRPLLFRFTRSTLLRLSIHKNHSSSVHDLPQHSLQGSIIGHREAIMSTKASDTFFRGNAETMRAIIIDRLSRLRMV